MGKAEANELASNSITVELSNPDEIKESQEQLINAFLESVPKWTRERLSVDIPGFEFETRVNTLHAALLSGKFWGQEELVKNHFLENRDFYINFAPRTARSNLKANWEDLLQAAIDNKSPVVAALVHAQRLECLSRKINSYANSSHVDYAKNFLEYHCGLVNKALSEKDPTTFLMTPICKTGNSLSLICFSIENNAQLNADLNDLINSDYMEVLPQGYDLPGVFFFDNKDIFQYSRNTDFWWQKETPDKSRLLGCYIINGPIIVGPEMLKEIEDAHAQGAFAHGLAHELMHAIAEDTSQDNTGATKAEYQLATLISEGAHDLWTYDHLAQQVSTSGKLSGVYAAPELDRHWHRIFSHAVKARGGDVVELAEKISRTHRSVEVIEIMEKDLGYTREQLTRMFDWCLTLRQEQYKPEIVKKALEAIPEIASLDN
jgi:hypothetical protein